VLSTVRTFPILFSLILVEFLAEVFPDEASQILACIIEYIKNGLE
jgi:hypothetical protein